MRSRLAVRARPGGRDVLVQQEEVVRVVVLLDEPHGHSQTCAAAEPDRLDHVGHARAPGDPALAALPIPPPARYRAVT
jgi:hypothetical protein